jgi:hypothetical protein
VRCLTSLANIIVAALIAATFASFTSAAAQGEANTAALVVVHDDGRVSYSLVQFQEESLTGTELLDRSGFDVTEISFGGLGIGVCSIDQTGCDVSVCRQRVCQGPGPDDPYWQYFIAGEDGTWSSSVLGVSADTVHAGDVRAFIWSAEKPDFSALDIDTVRAKATDQIADSVWLTRYAADGSVLQSDAKSNSSIPVSALALVALVAIGVVVVVGRSRSARSADG